MSLTLFDLPPTPPAPTARRSDPGTSWDAAKLAGRSASKHQLLCAKALRHDDMTDFELAVHTGVQQTSIGKRRLDLQRLGYVAPQDGRKRQTPSGAWAQVWKLTQAGRRWLENEETR